MPVFSFVKSQKSKVSSCARRGFTLIELLVVIAIIGILSSVVLASLNTARLKARDTRRVSDIKSIQLALEFYYDSKGYYPTSILTLVGSGGGQSLSAEPKDPSTGVSYVFAYKLLTGFTDRASAYHIGANLEQSVTTLLQGDRELDSTTGGYTNGFKGDDAGTCAATQATTGYCYDVSN